MKRFVLAGLLCLGLASSVFAQNSAPVTLVESSVGKIWWNGGNELIAESKIPDASKFRVRAPQQEGESGGGGAFSFDVGNVPGSSSTVEAVLLTGGINRYGGGESGFFILKRGTWGNISDAAQIRIWEATSDGIEFKVPVKAPNLGGGGGDYITAGAYRLYQQTDGNLVQYELVSGVLCARWSIWTGPIPKHTAQVPCTD